MNITTPLPAAQFELSIDLPSLVEEIAHDQPQWIRALILQTLESNLVPLTHRQVRELIVYLCPGQTPAQTHEVRWASWRIMQERLMLFTAREAKTPPSNQQNVKALTALGLTKRSAIKRRVRRRTHKKPSLYSRLQKKILGAA